ncbi:unnamed protein product (macronuclear) [Paramecium tetraurelia]|uniref:Uncharacterized protein n=1 Tax=Paramecium tetraurelia TaxID=5888 RepID=A0C0B3_PARTE|nr:uncharacterized protein GSPATT00006083001 [Paramecium tetraurelia]CAK64230.1 unnamed protein product [Paramecium tetraurelia]|eukprot:XP_001431628.1 hypothetical protein (macronuclear) [Paramecium tetraurelia strain d4-2]
MDINYLRYDNWHTDGTFPKITYSPMFDENTLRRSLFNLRMELGETLAVGFFDCQLMKIYRYYFRSLLFWWDRLIWSNCTRIVELSRYVRSGYCQMRTHKYEVHFALWAILKAPFLICCNFLNMSQDSKKILIGY